MKTFSYHVHSTFSDGISSMEDHVKKAHSLKSLDEMGFSDHLTIHPKEKKDPWAMDLKNFDAYITKVLSLSSHNLPVRLGIEADFFPETHEKASKLIEKHPFDYVIGSVHSVDDVAMEFKKFPSQDEALLLVKKYWQHIAKMAMCHFCDIVGHIDYYKRQGFFLPMHLYEKELDLALFAIKKANIAIEVNTSGWFHLCHEQYPSEAILIKCKKLDIPVVVTADAHHEDNLTRGFLQAFELIEKVGYTHIVHFEKRKQNFSNLSSKKFS